MEKQNEIVLKVSSYSMSPGPRYCDQGDSSGEDFYHKMLNKYFTKAFLENKKLVVDLDGPDGYASSFLDEAFGNLIFDFGIKQVKKRINILSNEEPEWLSMIYENTFEEWEKRKNSNEEPKVTANHDKWRRLIDNKIVEKQWIPMCSGK